MADSPGKGEGAFLTIAEVSRELGVAPHILRYWESRFPQLRPLQRAGNRRYYRPDDVALARRIHRLLNQEGYTVRGVQQMLSEGGDERVPPLAEPPAAPMDELRAIRDLLADALERDRLAVE